VKTFHAAHQALKAGSVALGNFDGVHRGHLRVLQQVLDEPCPTVLTFDPHPREYFRGETGFLLAPGQEKIHLLEPLGFAQTVVLPFTAELAALPAKDFIARILVEQLQIKRLSIGPDFQFGYQRSGNARLLIEMGAHYGFDVFVCPEAQWGEGRISSSAIRDALGQGDLATVRYLLGREYRLVGPVIHGEGRGRSLGFPTANLDISPRKFIPQTGVYLVRVGGLGMGLLNIGYRPTVSDSLRRSVEVHLLDWQGDLYGTTLSLELLAYLRPEQKFPSVEQLQAQIALDLRTARQLLASAR